MRKDRRHELQVNELSTQLERVSETVKQNATLLTAIVGGAIVVVIGGIWFVNQRANAQNAAWSRLSPSSSTDTTPTELISQYEAVAKDKVTPAITRSAWLKVGETAVVELMQNQDPNVVVDVKARDNLRDSAEEAFKAIVANPGNDTTALGRALIGLGVLAEDRGDFDKAKDFYKRVTDDEKLKITPIGDEANYRLEHMKNWETKIEFPEPEVPPAIEAPKDSTSDSGTFQPPAGTKPMKEIEPPPAKTDESASGKSDTTAETPNDTDKKAEKPQGAAADKSASDKPATETTETVSGSDE